MATSSNVSLAPPLKKCAIYTRKSSPHGLEQDFNSLKAQHAICSAYIQSQQHKGWAESAKVYEDAAQSGGTLNRPAMKELLADIERGKVDVVVVYKLDRLSRSLLDFVRLMDVFKRYDTSFACITQNFDTADSLGRLVMNVLLTFAQFERELTSDRIRDKRRAMSLKGLWSGGRPPLGYDLIDHHLVVNQDEALIVQRIYELYAENPNLTAVARACNADGYRSKTHMPATGILHVGVPLKATNIRKILMNPVYAGFVTCGGKPNRGIHQPIISVELWEKVSQLRAAQIAERSERAPRDVLDGLMYDCFGRSMTPNRLFRSGRLLIHYRSNQNAWGTRHGVKRMRANTAETEQLVIAAVQHLLCARDELRSILLKLGLSNAEVKASCRKAAVASRRLEGLSRDQLRSVLHGLIRHIELSQDRIKIITRAGEYEQLFDWDFVGLFRRRTTEADRPRVHVIDIPCAGAIRLERYVRLPIDARKAQTYRINKRLRELVSEARGAWDLIEKNRDLSPGEIATLLNMSLSHFMRLLRLNYLAPDIATSIMDGAQPRELTRRRLIDANLPLDWALQRELLGFPAQAPMRTIERSY
jgi:site-specific DNA recombinase